MTGFSPQLVAIKPAIAPPNALGLRSVMFTVESLDDTVARLRATGAQLVGEVAQYEDAYRLCYIRGPARIIVVLAGGARKYRPDGVQEINEPKYWEKPFHGVHSDIGGGYRNGGRNLEALRWMIERGQKAGAPFRNLNDYEFFKELNDANKNYQGHKSNYPILDRVPFTQWGRYKRKIFPGNN